MIVSYWFTLTTQKLKKQSVNYQQENKSETIPKHTIKYISCLFSLAWLILVKEKSKNREKVAKSLLGATHILHEERLALAPPIKVCTREKNNNNSI